jgi:hypothetical protein
LASPCQFNSRKFLVVLSFAKVFYVEGGEGELRSLPPYNVHVYVLKRKRKLYKIIGEVEGGGGEFGEVQARRGQDCHARFSKKYIPLSKRKLRGCYGAYQG